MANTAPSTPENAFPVLLVEDNKVNQRVGLLLLERLGLQAKIASNGREAVEAMGKEQFSVILMDCHMPEMDGFQATVAIRKLEKLSGSYTPIIAVTALSMSGDRERCIAAGMDDYLPKPIDKELLKIKLNHWLQREVVYRQLKLTNQLQRNQGDLAEMGGEEPINLREIAEFYGEDQMHQIVHIFIENTEDMLRRIGFFLKAHDAKAVAGLAHEFKASCASVGAKQLAKLSLYMEQAVGQEDWTEAEDTHRNLSRMFNRCKEFILSATWHKLA